MTDSAIINKSELTITEIVALSGDSFDNNDQDFDILFAALEAANLADALNDPNADLTVFAPTDEAFVKLAQDFGYRGIDEAEAFDTIVNTLTVLGEGDPIPLLQNILLYHVSPGAKDQTQLVGEIDTLLTDASLTVEGQQLLDNEPDLLDPNFEPSLADIDALNGIIQGIDRVLIPLDIEGNDASLINGTDDEDFLNGSSGRSIIQGGPGEDFILGSSRSDQLIGGEDDDLLFGNGGSDIFRGGAGNDLIISSTGDDLIDGGLDSDLIVLNGGMDTVVLTEGAGIDTINNFSMGSTTFALAGELSFEDLTIEQGLGFSVISSTTDILAQVVGISANDLNNAANFA